MKKNILLVFDKNEVGGATKSFLDFALDLSKTDNVTVLTPKKGIVFSKCKSKNINVIVTPFFPFIISDDYSFIKSTFKHLLVPALIVYRYVVNKYSLKRIIKKIDINNIDIIHTNLVRDDFGMLLAKKYGIYHIMHLREYGEIDYKYIKLKRNYIRYLEKNTNYFIAISNSIREHYIKLGIDEGKIKTIYNGVDVSAIEEKSDLFKQSGKIKIIFTGGIIPSKGQLQLFEAIAKLPITIQKELVVDCYGKADKNYLSQINNYIKNSNIKASINFKGYVNNIPSILKEYDLGMMCSVSEAFGRTTIEYMSAGLVVIATNKGANSELIKNNENGLLFNNIDELTEILEKIYNNEYNLNYLAKNAKDYSRNTFTKTINSQNIKKLYDQLLEV